MQHPLFTLAGLATTVVRPSLCQGLHTSQPASQHTPQHIHHTPQQRTPPTTTARRWLVPASVETTLPLHFDYSQKVAVAMTPLLRTGHEFASDVPDTAVALTDSGLELIHNLPPGQTVQLWVQLKVPDLEYQELVQVRRLLPLQGCCCCCCCPCMLAHRSSNTSPALPHHDHFAVSLQTPPTPPPPTQLPTRVPTSASRFQQQPTCCNAAPSTSSRPPPHPTPPQHSRTPCLPAPHSAPHHTHTAAPHPHAPLANHTGHG